MSAALAQSCGLCDDAFVARRRNLLRVVVAVLLVGAASLVLAVGCCAPQIALASMTPHGEIDPTTFPTAPTYARDDAWLSLPTRNDEADVALPELPAIDQTHAPVDVFYVHPTTSIAPRWVIGPGEDDVRTASIRGGTLIQASVFNACCAVYAPTYRQATGVAYVHPSPSGDRAIEVAYGDVVAAFDEFLRRTGGARPFIVAGHSQGAALATRLVREKIASTPLRARLVAAYLVGAPVLDGDTGEIHACKTPQETGCIVTFNARGPQHVRGELDFGRAVPEASRVCVNPTLGFVSTDAVPRARHGGAVFFDADKPALLPAFAASRCVGGRLVVTERQPLPARDAMSGILLWVLGGENLHPIEYQLFYADLRADAVRRAAAFVATPASSTTP